ncbi:MAG: hypothetical protein KME12_21185 [Trichocoleus desertorum ATA4-8-CV12]|jgi:hypothetical protein|nr:hypothetical protein [Trichocoleus desertorum ATA4-8-CV12]
MEIRLGEGIGKLLFGITENEISHILGLPDKSYPDDYGDRFIQYFDARLILKLESEWNYRLGWIEVNNPQATLFGQQLLGSRKREVVDFVSQRVNTELEIEDFGSFESYTFTEVWLELQFELDRLRCINFGVLFDENDEPLYPDIKTSC